jgi:hypothetical protein
MGSTLPDWYLLERDAEVACVGGPGERKGLPKFDYHLDESDSDVMVLRRQDGVFVLCVPAPDRYRIHHVSAARSVRL